MTRKDSEKDSDRPHYYSQFWLDIAAGRRVIGGPKTSDDVEAAENETTEPAPRHKAEQVSELEDDFAGEDGHEEAIMHPVVEEPAVDEFIEPEAAEEEPEEEEVESPDLLDTTVDDIDIPDVDLTPADEEEEELFEEEEEEEDDDIGWGGRGRKKPKPSRPTKLPQKKPSPGGRRDTRRGGY
ncbi:MAG TPA: hypothetical protein VKR06_18925 [Ktedonosporobacter sp.]|nr:hypothetical protein [Ktedonosporobacter sp.]